MSCCFRLRRCGCKRHQREDRFGERECRCRERKDECREHECKCRERKCKCREHKDECCEHGCRCHKHEDEFKECEGNRREIDDVPMKIHRSDIGCRKV